MKHDNPIKNLLSSWPTRADLAGDLSSILGRKIKSDRVHKWAASGSIPQEFMAPVIQAAKSRGIKVTAQELVEMHSAQTPEGAE